MKKFTLVACILFVIISNSFSQVHQQHIRITSPLNNSHVPQDGNTVEFSTPAVLAIGTKPVVFVKDPTGQYWPYNGSDQNNRRWTIQDVQFGNEHDFGRRFEITVIIVNDRLLENGFSYHGRTVYIENNTPISLGAFIYLLGRGDNSQKVTVIRN